MVLMKIAPYTPFNLSNPQVSGKYVFGCCPALYLKMVSYIVGMGAAYTLLYPCSMPSYSKFVDTLRFIVIEVGILSAL
jgi:hypothetical protein